MAKSGGGGGGSGGGNSPPPPGVAPTFDLKSMQQELSAAVGGLAEMYVEATTKTEKQANAIATLQNGMQALSAVFQGLSAVSSIAHLALDGFSTVVQSVAGKIGGLVKLVNPGVLDQFQRAFSAFQSQLGEVFAPLLMGLGQLVQTVANAMAGLAPQGRAFILFLSGAAAGIGVAVTLGGVFVTMLGAVAGAMIAGAIAGEALGVALDIATAGAASIGQVIGVALGGAAGVGGIGAAATGGAAAGGVAALAVAGGTIEQFMATFEPFLNTLVGAFNNAGAALLPQLGAAIREVMPPLNDLFGELVQYLPLLGEVLATFATEMIPELVKIAVIFAREFLPIAAIMAKMAVEAVRVAGALLTLTRALIELAASASPLLALLRVARPNNRGGQTGQAPSPTVSASYTGIEELFRKSQEAAILGRPTGDDPFAKTMNDPKVQKHWARAIVEAMTTGSVLGQVLGKSMTESQTAAAARTE